MTASTYPSSDNGVAQMQPAGGIDTLAFGYSRPPLPFGDPFANEEWEFIAASQATGPAPGYARTYGDLLELFAQSEPFTADNPFIPSPGSPAAAGSPAEAAAMKHAGGRVPVEVSADEYRTNDAALAALAEHEPDLYVQQGRLVQVVREQEDVMEHGAEWESGTPRIKEVNQSYLPDILTKRCFFYVAHEAPDGRVTIEQRHPPQWCVKALHSRPRWEGLRPIQAIVEVPVIRPDGSVLNTPGWDVTTSLLYEPIGGVVPDVPSEPTIEDARSAAERLLELVADFEFSTDADRSAFLAALLTPIARPAINGFAPLFVFDAPTAGSGKSLLTDVISAISQGQWMPRMANPKDREETRKAIPALVLSGATLVSIDNVSGELGNDVLDLVLTGEKFTGRLLGGNEFASVSLLNLTWFATGNNIQLKGDTFRRVLLIRLQPTVERPDQRTGFAIPRLVDHVKANRAELASDAVTIIAAYFRAGRPEADIPNWGSYEEWSGIIRQAIVWAGMPDPYETVTGIIDDADSERSAFAALVANWEDLASIGKGVTTAEIAKKLNQITDNDVETLIAMRDAALELAGKDGKVDGRRLGNAFRDHDGQVFGDFMFKKVPSSTKHKRWKVDELNRQNPELCQ